MAKKTKEEIYEWVTSQNWFRFYESSMIAHPSKFFVDSKATCFKEYLEYAWDRYKRTGDYGLIEYLCSSGYSLSPINNITGMGSFFGAIDNDYWNIFHKN